MAKFTNQENYRNQVIMALAPLIPEFEKWRDVWLRMDDQKKIDFLCEHKSLIAAGAGIYIHMRPFFKKLDDEIDKGEIALNLADFTLRRP